MQFPLPVILQLLKAYRAIICPGNGTVLTPAQQQEQASIAAKEAIDAMTQHLLSTHAFPLGPAFTLEQVTAHVLQDEGMNPSSIMETAQDLATYGVGSEFFIATMRTLCPGGGWG